MGFHVDLASLKSDADAYFKSAEKTIDEMESAKVALNKIVTSNALYGSAGEAVSNDVNNNLNAMLTALKDEYREVSIGFKQDIQGFKQAVGEGSDSAVLDEDTLNKLVTKLDQMAKDQDDLARNGKKIFASIDDIISLSAPHSSFPTGTRETMKQIKKIITKVTEFDHAKGVEASLSDLLQQTNAKLNEAGKFGDSGYTDSNFQSYLGEASFAASVAAFDAPIEKGIKAEEKAKLDAKKAQTDWKNHHPLQSLWQEAEKAVGTWWQDVQDYNDNNKDTSDFEKGLQKFFSGALGAAGEFVAGVVTMVAWGLETTFESAAYVTGFADKTQKRDLNGISDNINNVLAHPLKSGEAVVEMAVSAVGGVLNDVRTGNLYNLGGDAFNIGSMFVGVGETKSALEGAEAVTKLSKLREVDEILAQSTAKSSSLVKYLKVSDKSAFKELRKFGTWKQEIQVPKAESVLTKRGTIDWDQVPKGGYILNSIGEPIKSSFSPSKGSVWDRFGSNEGRYMSPVGADGKSFSYSERSLPYVEDLHQYHKYTAVDDFQNIKKYVHNCSDLTVKARMNAVVDKYFNGNWDNVKVYQGKVAKGFEANGGGIQAELPFSMSDLEKIGFFTEVK